MRIAFLTQVLPYPLDAGPKVRAYYVLRHLARRHAVTLVSFVRATDTDDAVDHLRRFCQDVCTVPMPRSRRRDAWHLVRSLFTRSPFIIARDSVPAMATLIQGLMASDTEAVNTERLSSEGRFDAIHADQLWMAQYALQARRAINRRADGSAEVQRPRLVLDQHNAVHQIVSRMAAAQPKGPSQAFLELEARKMARYEADVCEQFDRLVWVSREDQMTVHPHARLSEGSSQGPPTIIPICVDADATAQVPRIPDPFRVTFVGGLHYPPNAQGLSWYAEHVFPSVIAQVPGAVLTVIGKPPARVNLTALDGVPQSNLEATGYVEDVRPYLRETAVFVVPLQAGGGMRVKILDAWCWGAPIVSTTVGAEGIEVLHGENILIADGPADSARATVRVLRDSDLAARMIANGRLWVKRRYDWRTTYRAWDEVYDGLAA